MIYRLSGLPGAVGCGLGLVFLGLFLLTPLAVFLIKGIGWMLVAIGLLIVGLTIWRWFRSRWRV